MTDAFSSSDGLCPPDCRLCAIERRIEAHADACLVCNFDIDENPCAIMRELEREEQAALDELFPDRNLFGPDTSANY